MKKRTAWALAASVAAVAVGAAAVGALALVLRGGGGGARWRGDSYLYLNLQEEVPEEPPSQIGNLLERRPPSLRTLVESIDRAGRDPKVKALVLRVGILPDAGWGKVQELRDAIERYRLSGKPAYAHLEICGNREYYLATACTKVYAIPTALLNVTGLAAEVTFFRRSLDKLGVEAQFEGVGKYKNAPNQFTEDHLTGPHREQTEALLDSLYSQYVAAIGASRHKTAAEVQGIVDHGPYDGSGALAAGLVDELIYLDQVEERLKTTERLNPGPYVKGTRGFAFDRRPKLAVVYAVGDIIPGESRNGPFGGDGFVGSDTVAAALRTAREDDSIRGVILRVDSPGGAGTASEVIWREVALTRKQKPVVASMGDVAASGGYYISMGTDAIVAQPGTITGSIGVFGGKFTLRGLYDKLGVTREIIPRGAHAAIFSEYRPWTEEERNRIHDEMVAFYHDFVSKVAAGRQKSYSDIDAVAQGRVWTGTDALRIGLVDRLGGLDTALGILKERAHIAKDQEVALVVLPEPKGLLETILERQEEGFGALLPREVRAGLRWARFGDLQPLARLPFDLRVR